MQLLCVLHVAFSAKGGSEGKPSNIRKENSNHVMVEY